jgi:sugar phosphate isomerase/epimerase
MKTLCFSIKWTSSIYLLLLLLSFSCGKNQKTTVIQETANTPSEPFFEISLAQWSLHKTFNDNGVSPFEFAKRAKSMGFETVEYVSQLYKKQIDVLGFDTVIDSLKKESEKYSLKNNLIMVDHEGDLAAPDIVLRNQAVENHKKWVDAAEKLGCQAIRVNTFGTNDSEVWAETVVDGLKKLSDYAATKNINVICENHGWLSSDIPKLMQAIHRVNRPNCGTLPDFGNWCIKRSEDYFGGGCLELFHDKYEGVKLMLPKAFGVSAKSYNFDQNGNETTIDYVKMLQIVKDSGFKGYVGVEFETQGMDEKEGIMATKNLLIKAAKELEHKN